MTLGERALVTLSAAIASNDADARKNAVAEAARNAPEAAEEVILQSYLFLGYPAALRMMAEWRSRTGRTAPEHATDDTEDWAERGERVCATVYGGQYERLRRNIASLHPDVERWMVTEGYGKVLGRPGLSLRVRELCIIVLLAGQSASAQLYSHLRGARNAGATRNDVEETLEIAEDFIPAERLNEARAIWGAVLAREDEAGGKKETSCS